MGKIGLREIGCYGGVGFFCRVFVGMNLVVFLFFGFEFGLELSVVGYLWLELGFRVFEIVGGCVILVRLGWGRGVG